jgi:hypothetical protein
MTTGSRAQVFHGTADRTSGGLTKKHLKKSKDGRIVSRLASKKTNPSIRAWAQATKKVMGARKSTKFVPIKKGSPVYKKILAEFKKIMK